jgi:TonB family protein
MRTRIAVTFLLSLLTPFFGFSPARAQDTAESGRKVVTRVTPQYPPLCRTLRLSGSVKVDALVAENGTVKSLEVKGGHPVLVEAAKNAVIQWKWVPASHATHESVELRFNP